MAVAALITWLITAVGGFVTGCLYALSGSLSVAAIYHALHNAPLKALGGVPVAALAPGLVFSHVGLAVIGLVVWIVYLAVDKTALAWIAFVLLLPVAGLGFTMLARWIPARRTGTAESRFPVPVVAGHGLFAATTLVLVLLAALGGLNHR